MIIFNSNDELEDSGNVEATDPTYDIIMISDINPDELEDSGNIEATDPTYDNIIIMISDINPGRVQTKDQPNPCNTVQTHNDIQQMSSSEKLSEIELEEVSIKI